MGKGCFWIEVSAVGIPYAQNYKGGVIRLGIAQCDSTFESTTEEVDINRIISR